MFCVCIASSLQELWDEYDKGLATPGGGRTQPLRTYCNSEDHSWRGTKNAKMRNLLLRRKRIWGAMQVAFDAAEGHNDSEREAKMLVQIEQVRLGVCENCSMNRLSDHFKGALQ